MSTTKDCILIEIGATAQLYNFRVFQIERQRTCSLAISRRYSIWQERSLSISSSAISAHKHIKGGFRLLNVPNFITIDNAVPFSNGNIYIFQTNRSINCSLGPILNFRGKSNSLELTTVITRITYKYQEWLWKIIQNDYKIDSNQWNLF